MAEFLNFYKIIKDLRHTHEPEIYYNFMWLLEKCMNIFTYENVPESLNSVFFDASLYINGTCAITSHNGKLNYVSGGYSGEPTIYFLNKEYTFANVEYSGTLTVGKDIYVCHNTRLLIPLYWIIKKYAQEIFETEKSYRITNKLVRLSRIAYCENSTQKTQLEESFKDLLEGRLVAFADGGSFGEEGVRLLELYTPQSNGTSLIATLLQAREELLSQFYNELGLPLNTKAKKAQLITDEMENYDSFSKVTIYDMLTAREEFFEKINRIFGTDIKVKLNPLFWEESAESAADNTDDESALITDDNTDDESALITDDESALITDDESALITDDNTAVNIDLEINVEMEEGAVDAEESEEEMV